jgi:DNA-binding transcriptional ArsR family regulator
MPNFDLQQMHSHVLNASQLLKMLSHPVRLIVLCSLIDNELNVGELLALSQVSQSVLSQHLALLRQNNLVKTRRDAQVIYYQLSDNKSTKIIETLHQIFCDTTSNQEKK